jgi:predicted NBD/HSP70 family sugar kinase
VIDNVARRLGAAIASVTAVIDPELIVLGGGIGQAPGFADAVTAELRLIAPVMPQVRVSALGTEAVVDGCLAAGFGLAWTQVTAAPAAVALPDQGELGAL